MKAIEEDYQFKGKKEKMLDEGTGFASQDTKLIHYLSPLSWYVLITLVWLSTRVTMLQLVFCPSLINKAYLVFMFIGIALCWRGAAEIKETKIPGNFQSCSNSNLVPERAFSVSSETWEQRRKTFHLILLGISGAA